jgi:hypothetical protein
MLCLEKVSVAVKQELAQSVEDNDRDIELVKRRAGLAALYDALPAYGSTARVFLILYQRR